MVQMMLSHSGLTDNDIEHDQRAIRRLSSGARRTSDHKESGASNEAV